MTNYDKHKDKILKLAKERYSDLNTAEALAARDISGLADANNVIKWLFHEYEPLLLKNGDGLNPGNWIMVRNSDKETWTSQVFLCFIYGYFVCVCDKDYIGHGGNYQLWKQARWPEDGE